MRRIQRKREWIKLEVKFPEKPELLLKLGDEGLQ
jgi:hypothetical protein